MRTKYYSCKDCATKTFPKFVTMGRGTYFPDGIRWKRFMPDETVTIGNFCSISLNVQFVCGGCHQSNLVSTFPLNPKRSYDFNRPRSIVIENDVWIGEDVFIGGGAVVRNGAILGSGSVIFGEVPPYAVMIGNPAKVYRYRFSKRTIRELLKIAWWNWPSLAIKSCEEWFYGPVEEFIEEFK